MIAAHRPWPLLHSVPSPPPLLHYIYILLCCITSWSSQLLLFFPIGSQGEERGAMCGSWERIQKKREKSSQGGAMRIQLSQKVSHTTKFFFSRRRRIRRNAFNAKETCLSVPLPSFFFFLSLLFFCWVEGACVYVRVYSGWIYVSSPILSLHFVAQTP